MKRKTRLLFLFILLSALASAQEEFVPAPARLITSFKFKILTGGVVTFKARVSNFPDTLNFILDTGSGGISLDSMTVIQLGIESQLSDRTIRGIAGIRQVKFAYNHKLHLPGLTVDSLNFHVNDYDVLTSAYGEKVDGIVGFSFLSRYIVKIDYDSLRIDVLTKGTLKYPRGGFMLRPILATIPVVNTEIRDERALRSRFYFDTGAGLCLLLSQEFVDDSAFVRKKTKWFNTQAEGLGGKTSMKQGVLKMVRIGPYRFKNVPTFIFNDDYNVTSYPYLGGLIGNDLLRRFNLIINYATRDLHLTPNSHFKDKFDYSYTGLGIYLVEGEIVIMDIMEGSPGEKAGFLPGDIILGINTNFTRNIQAYKTMLQSPGERLKILVLRGNGPLVINLKVQSIL